MSYLQCHDDNGNALFDADDIKTIVSAVVAQAVDAARKGDDRRLKRMVDAHVKLAQLNSDLMAERQSMGELDAIITRLRDRQRATGNQFHIGEASQADTR